MTSQRKFSVYPSSSDTYSDIESLSEPFIGGQDAWAFKFDRSSIHEIRRDKSTGRFVPVTNTSPTLKSVPLVADTLQLSKRVKPLSAMKKQLVGRDQSLPVSILRSSEQDHHLPTSTLHLSGRRPLPASKLQPLLASNVPRTGRDQQLPVSTLRSSGRDNQPFPASKVQSARRDQPLSKSTLHSSRRDQSLPVSKVQLAKRKKSLPASNTQPTRTKQPCSMVKQYTSNSNFNDDRKWRKPLNGSMRSDNSRQFDVEHNYEIQYQLKRCEMRRGNARRGNKLQNSRQRGGEDFENYEYDYQYSMNSSMEPSIQTEMNISEELYNTEDLDNAEELYGPEEEFGLEEQFNPEEEFGPEEMFSSEELNNSEELIRQIELNRQAELERQMELFMMKKCLGKVKKIKKKRKKKNDVVIKRLKNLGKSLIDLDTMEGKIHVAKAIYPGVLIGHKHCIDPPIVMPKMMGWLWSVKESAGVPINPNWRPGAIPKNVAIVMENTRNGYYEELAKEDAAKKELVLKRMRERKRRLLKKYRNNG